MRKEYVDLGRRFLPFQEATDSDEATWISYYRPQYEVPGSTDWGSLTAPESRCVVVLGEAGSGKSWEFEARAEFLNNNGSTAFYLPIDDLVDQDIERNLARPDVARLKDWLCRSDEAVFFLDAIDDARLRDSHALRKALITLDKTLNASFDRACIILSCRVSDWQATADLDLLRRYFGDPDSAEDSIPLSRKKKPACFRVVQLASLDRTQVGLLAQARGVDSREQFLADVDAADAWMFAGRPRDVDDLIAFWKEHRKLGSLTDLIEQNVTRKLRETKLRDDVLETVRARRGVERLAAATVLCRKNTFLLPDDPAIR
jgi:hypothetical protein